jgi:hypothetical protein
VFDIPLDRFQGCAPPLRQSCLVTHSTPFFPYRSAGSARALVGASGST